MDNSSLEGQEIDYNHSWVGYPSRMKKLHDYLDSTLKS